MRRTWAAGLTLLLCSTAVTAGCSGTSGEAAQPTPTKTVDDSKVNSAMYDCLLDRGFAVTRGEDGTIQFTDPKDEQFSAYEQANRDCHSSLVSQGLLPGGSTDALRAEYAALTAWHKCLVTAGFPLADWPTEEVFVEADGDFNVLDATAPVQVAEAEQACPAEFAEVQQS